MSGRTRFAMGHLDTRFLLPSRRRGFVRTRLGLSSSLQRVGSYYQAEGEALSGTRPAGYSTGPVPTTKPKERLCQRAVALTPGGVQSSSYYQAEGEALSGTRHGSTRRCRLSSYYQAEGEALSVLHRRKRGRDPLCSYYQAEGEALLGAGSASSAR